MNPQTTQKVDELIYTLSDHIQGMIEDGMHGSKEISRLTDSLANLISSHKVDNFTPLMDAEGLKPIIEPDIGQLVQEEMKKDTAATVTNFNISVQLKPHEAIPVTEVLHQVLSDSYAQMSKHARLSTDRN